MANFFGIPKEYEDKLFHGDVFNLNIFRITLRGYPHKSDLNMNARVRTEIDLDKSEVDLNECLGSSRPS